MLELKDSGERRSFDSGAVRDIQEGKGRCDLLPLDIIAVLIGVDTDDDILIGISNFIRVGNTGSLYAAIDAFSATYFGGTVTAMLEVAKQYEAGCAKYGDRNWEKGIPLHCYIDSGVRHYLKFLRGDTDERHDIAFIWNILGCLWTLRHKPELNDLPCKELI